MRIAYRIFCSVAGIALFAAVCIHAQAADGPGLMNAVILIVRHAEKPEIGEALSPEGQKRISEKGPASIRGLLNLMGRKLDLVAEYEDRVPAYVEQMFDRLEASGIIVGWDRNDWEIWTTRIGLDVRIAPRAPAPDGA